MFVILQREVLCDFSKKKILIKWCIICSLLWRTASAKNLKASSNNQMTKDQGRESANNAQRYSSLFFSYLQNFSLVLESFNAVN